MLEIIRFAENIAVIIKNTDASDKPNDFYALLAIKVDVIDRFITIDGITINKLDSPTLSSMFEFCFERFHEAIGDLTCRDIYINNFIIDIRNNAYCRINL